MLRPDLRGKLLSQAWLNVRATQCESVIVVIVDYEQPLGSGHYHQNISIICEHIDLSTTLTF